MKKLGLFNRIIYYINALFAVLLLLSFLLPYLPPKTFLLLSVLNLGVSSLVLINVLFLLYWLIKLKKQFLLSLLVLLTGYFSFGLLYQFSTEREVKEVDSFKIMSYNVRLFNLYDWIPEKTIETKIVDLIKTENPDIVSFQEYYNNKNIDLSFLKYNYIENHIEKKFGLAIFSKFPIINSGSLDFPGTGNNAIFIDVVKDGTDTIRMYNLHLESHGMGNNMDKFKNEDLDLIIKNIGKTFKKQQLQAELFIKHKEQCEYKTIICGDFNNTEFSYIYREIKGDLNDAFKEAGSGFGRTYDFKFFPVRIDFIFADKDFIINDFKCFDERYSDHFPISTTLSLK